MVFSLKTKVTYVDVEVEQKSTQIQGLAEALKNQWGRSYVKYDYSQKLVGQLPHCSTGPVKSSVKCNIAFKIASLNDKPDITVFLKF